MEPAVPCKYQHYCSPGGNPIILDFVHRHEAVNDLETEVSLVSAQVKLDQGIAGDRRDDRRYEVTLDLRWKLVRRRKVLHTGEGQTVDLSSGGILFDARRPLPVGLDVELSIAWPILLNNTAPMQLVITGRIVRCTGNTVAIRMVQHEFRTLGVASEQGHGPGAAKQPLVMMTNRGSDRFEILH